MADIRDLKTKFSEVIRGWLIDCNYTDENIVDTYYESEEIDELAERLLMIVKYHKGDKC